MRVWESRSPPAYRTTSDELVSSEVVSILCFSLAEFRRDFRGVLKGSQISLRIFRGVLKGSQISQISQILGCFLRKMRAQIGVFTAFQS